MIAVRREALDEVLPDFPDLYWLTGVKSESDVQSDKHVAQFVIGF
jgi:hypothetical protein